MKYTNAPYLRLSLLNLLIVATLGVLMRYKIGFEFPWFDQKNMQHAHSHFAFYGWITHSLFSLMTAYITGRGSQQLALYRRMILINLFCAYGMLLAFFAGGYNPVSITFSTLAILNSFWFSYHYVRDLRLHANDEEASNWFSAALVFNALSSAGTFTLAYLMASGHIPQHLYLASVYFYLHFQYNGWFFFASMGLAGIFLKSYVPDRVQDKRIFWLFALSCVPAYLLSALWMNLPLWLYLIVVAAAITQFVAWGLWLRNVLGARTPLKQQLHPLVYWLMMVVAAAVSIKFLLQLGSVIPYVSKLAFGFRPIVIAYLHLALLAIISAFLLIQLFSRGVIRQQRFAIAGLVLFASGIYLTEIVLAIQGIASFSYTLVPFTDGVLFFLALCMFTGIAMLCISTFLFKPAKHDIGQIMTERINQL